MRPTRRTESHLKDAKSETLRRSLGKGPIARRFCQVLAAAAMSVSCAHMSGNETNPSGSAVLTVAAPTSGLRSLPIDRPIALRLKGDLTRTERVRYCARSVSKIFDAPGVVDAATPAAGSGVSSNSGPGAGPKSAPPSAQPAKPELANKQKSEATEFVVETKTTKLDPALDRIVQVLRTIKKAGGMDLHDFAMPEPKEALEMTVTGQGQILRAGNYPKNSLYFVPTVSLPGPPVGKGETWVMQAQWSPIGESSVLQLDMLSILKGLWTCGADRCAEIEISGDVAAGQGGARIAGYKNDWHGAILFDIDAGAVVWSKLVSDESFESDTGKRTVRSSLDGAMLEPMILSEAQLGTAPCSENDVASQARLF